MKTSEFIKQLQEAHSISGLTKAELARWFDRSYWTVERWLNGSTPHLERKEAEERLELLCLAIKLKLLPLPPNTTGKSRQVNLRGIYIAVNQPISPSSVA